MEACGMVHRPNRGAGQTTPAVVDLSARTSLSPSRAVGRWASILGLILGFLHGSPTVSAQGPGAGGLATNEVLVYLNVLVLTGSTNRHADPSGEYIITTETGVFKAVGTYAAIMDASVPGKREFYLFRPLPRRFTGSLVENFARNQDGSFGEDGLFSRKNNAHAEWSHDDVELGRPSLTLELDLDARTWRMQDVQSGVDGLLNRTIRGFSYSASRNGPDTNNRIRMTTTSNPNKPLIDVPAGTPKQIQAALLSLSPQFAAFALPQPLTVNEGVGFSGSYDPPPAISGQRFSGVSIRWSIVTERPKLELHVTSPDLQQWRPKALRVDVPPSGYRIDPGPPLTLTARVVDPSGAPPQVRIRKLRWWLEDTSRLPGIAMNFPYQASDLDLDLDIDHPNATEEGQRLEVRDLTTLAHTIKVRPHDWGAWAVLRAEAELDDGRTLKGILPTQSGDQTAIRLPARDEDSKIADVWKRQSGSVGDADDADDDFVPQGAARGDGFTVFEEYRGFYGWLDPTLASGPPKHLWTNPSLKTVFVYDRIGDEHTGKAMSLFKAASQASVPVVKPGYQLSGESRLMNPNVGAGPTKGPQHAIGLRRGVPWLPTAPGSPGQSEVQIPSFETIRRSFPNLASLDLYQRAIATHMLLACRVPLPGSGDRYMTLSLSRAPDGSPVVRDESGQPVQLRDEFSDASLAEAWVRQAERSGTVLEVRSGIDAPASYARGLKVAVRGGQHSGPLANIMRSASAEAYTLDGGRSLVILSPTLPEQIGYSLPSTSQGDGYNADDWNRPRPRYGNSSQPAPREAFSVSDHAP